VTDEQATINMSVTTAADPLLERSSEVTREMLRDGIRQLEPAQRDALRLATRDQLHIGQIAEQMGITAEAVELHLRDGLLALRASLIDQLSGSAS
jgi:DNA-directed RNA polymerase specialized sigma24 family protein